MPFEVHYSSDFYRIEVNVADNLLRSEWLRAVSKVEMVTGGTKLMEALQETVVELAIADARVLTALTSETKEWMATKFYELLSKTNLKRLARITPSDLFSKIALESVATRSEALNITKFSVMNFTDPEEGLRWLLS
ncbi:hypothetical protein [Pontibacter akesuensis]|uniref:SpoIIAA-like n=1 Tax=Pontibacter akesuensis TaxID=388950 RepID=A0A1I7FP64_9BACT|nr:hypothetical protein [Pontibacter akesuensis]GHA61183.1 hypothetical protein GCM10007389_11990 [Pontibacter akesuensis]SFU37997.1 hypothetical protein SAMN04487941_0363 [Pontibacter akesuensis]